ncbi:MAG: methyltransferase domain-containing protein, partial [Sphingobium sp.]
HRFCARRGAPVRLIGIDLNPRSLSVARAATPPDMVIDYRIGDLYRLPPEEEIDLVVSSLVTHHMQDEEIVRFLRWMTARARTGWFVNDLHRHPVAYHGFRLLSAAMRWHPFVRHDGPLSVARAFHRQDWERLIGAAGLTDGTALRWHFPFRYCVTHWT